MALCFILHTGRDSKGIRLGFGCHWLMGGVVLLAKRGVLMHTEAYSS